jgi:hypothetical protein
MSHVFTLAYLAVLNFIANIFSPIIHFFFIWDLATYIFYIYLKKILHKL